MVCDGKTNCEDNIDENDGCISVERSTRNGMDWYSLESSVFLVSSIWHLDHINKNASLSDNELCKTKKNIPCEYPFSYNGNYYDACINIDSGGKRWCYTNITTKSWDFCDEFNCQQKNG